MDWTIFRDKIGKVQIPTIANGFTQKFIEAENSIQIQISTKDTELQQFTTQQYEDVINTIQLLEGRGAKREKDYIITATGIGFHGLEIAVHTTNDWLSDEDFVA